MAYQEGFCFASSITGKQTTLIIECVMQAGMTTFNDFATSYMNQSLPFGGVKNSGFDRLAGVGNVSSISVDFTSAGADVI